MTPYKFCPCCGSRLSTRRVEGKPRLVCGACRFVFFQNSKPCVGGLVFRAGEILLTKRGVSPYQGFWDIPGGFLEPGEPPEDGLKREIWEELGLRCRVRDLFGILMDTYGKSGDPTLNLFYFVEPRGKIRGASDDVAEYAFFPLSRLPRKIAFRSARGVLALLQKKLPEG